MRSTNSDFPSPHRSEAPDGQSEPDAEATVTPVGTFVAGQSPAGKYVVVAEEPIGSFAAGQANNDDDEAERPH
jgi:hypothetical protein